MTNKKRVLLGMSGGVDSSVAAYLLKEQGYEVVGATMQLWDMGEGVENTAIKDAKKVCEKLGISHTVLDFQENFKNKVINNFISEYFEGHTPNPCVFCNKHIKFNELYNKAEELGCEYVATGHYALIEYNDETGKYELKRAANDKKDQTYVLYNMNQDKLSKTLFPIGNFDKSRIREIAKEIGLEVHNKPDSQDICFIPNHDYEEFLLKNADRKAPKGKFVDKDGNEMGEHNGVISYTIGQRKGLGVTFGKPTYVIDINGKNNSVTLGGNEDLFKDTLTAKDVNFLMFSIDELDETKKYVAKIRYSSNVSFATIKKIGENRVEVKFETPQRAITKGQSVVFYDGDVLVGGGIIE
ncbi:tRNA 2-thiouridine(34) synthase MnmA [Peptostreptococcus faecalis]|uniref:tRNA 2-thiouridine(34) synthase MnmA n=1 Tax=Peptostreptococcus faecalis TaxID=2045015 RepID=UPI000C7BF7EF